MAGELALPMLPFEAATRKIRQPMGTLQFAPGAAGLPKVQADIPPAGLLARIYCHVTATNTVTLGGGTAALDWSGPWSSISKVRVTSPGGLEQYSLSGFATYLQSLIENYAFEPESSRVNVSVPSHFGARVFAAGVAAGANTWEFGFTIPVALNEREALGLLMMQNSSSAFQISFEYNTAMYSTTAGQAPVLVTGAATSVVSAGTITCEIETFAVPDDRKIELPPDEFAHTYREYYKTIGGVGDFDISITDQHRFLSILHHVALNNTPNSVDVDALKLQFSSSFSPIVVPNRIQLQIQHKAYGRALPNGVFVHDFENQGIPNYGTQRDWVDGQRVSDLRSYLTIAAGATLGTNASRVLTVTRQLQRVVAPAMASRS